MVDLGPHAAEVLSAYAGALLLLAGLIGVTIWRARRVAGRLREVEARRGRGSTAAGAAEPSQMGGVAPQDGAS